MKTTILGHAGALVAALAVACTLDSTGRTLFVSSGHASTGGSGSTGSSSGAGGANDNGDTQASGAGGHSCDTPADCPGSDSACETRTCENSVCEIMLTPSGTALPEDEQAPGDCKEQQCGDNGEIVTVAAAQDIPSEDGRECTLETCDGTTPLYKPLPGTACGTGSCAGVMWTRPACNAQGECVAGTSMDCTPYQCTPTGCKSLCQDTQDCAPGYLCSSSVCVPQP